MKRQPEPRDVCSAVAVYGGQYCGGLLCDYAERAGVGGGPCATSTVRRWRLGLRCCLTGWMDSIARMTNTTSDFGKELDSLADVITFGVAPSLLAYMWGFRMLPATGASAVAGQIAASGSLRLLHVSDLRSEPAGAVQYQHQSAAAQSGAAGEEVFCRDADSGGRGCDRFGDSFFNGFADLQSVDGAWCGFA